MRLLPITFAVAVATFVPGLAFAAAPQTSPDCMSANAELAATVERTTFRSRGREIQGLLYRPTHPNGAGVVVLHDREGIQKDLGRFETQVGRLASCGYTVIVPSYYDAAGPRSVNDPMLQDKWMQVIDEAIRALSGVDGVDAARIGVWGYGRGGVLALDDAFDGIAAKAVVAVSAATRPERPRGSPPPILLISGDHDPDAPAYVAEQFVRDIRRFGEIDMEVQSVSASLHEFTPATWDEVFQQTRAFLDARLAPSA